MNSPVDLFPIVNYLHESFGQHESGKSTSVTNIEILNPKKFYDFDTYDETFMVMNNYKHDKKT